MDLHLKDKRALVTGASRGLGYATAKGLAQEGSHVAINGRNEDKLNRAAKTLAKETGQPIHPLSGDLTNSDTPAQLIKEAVGAMGGLDILITNAGGPPSGSFESFDEDTWAKAVDLS